MFYVPRTVLEKVSCFGTPCTAWYKRGRFMGNIRYKLAFLSQPVFSGIKGKNTNLPSESWLKGKLKQYKLAFPSCYRHPNQASPTFRVWQSFVYSRSSSHIISSIQVLFENVCSKLTRDATSCSKLSSHKCICVYMYPCVYMYICVCMNMYTYAYMYISQIDMCSQFHTWKRGGRWHAYIYIYINTWIYTYIYIHIYMYIYIYT